MKHLVDKIVSGGQTSADRGGLDAAIDLKRSPGSGLAAFSAGWYPEA